MVRNSATTERLRNLIAKIDATTQSGELHWERQAGSAHRYARLNNNLLILGPATPLRESVPASPEGAARSAFGLTPREREILSSVVTGYTNREIAQKFVLSEDTVKHHLSNIFDKVGASNRVELTLFAVHHDLIDRG